MTKAELEAFQAVVRHGSISAAAAQIYLSQPALSRRLRALERELGYPLFLRDRGFRAATLTPEGQLFVQVSEQLLRGYRDAAALPHRAQRQTLHIGAVSSVAAFLLPPVLIGFHRQHPQVQLEFTQVRSADAYPMVEMGQLDYALVSDFRRTDSALLTPVWKQPYVLVAAQGTFPEGVTVAPDQLNPEEEIWLPWGPEFLLWHERWFPGSCPKVKLNHIGPLSAFLTESSYVIAPYTVAVHLPGHRIYPLREGPADRIIYALTPNRTPSSSVQAFRRYLRQALSQYGDVTLFPETEDSTEGNFLQKAENPIP